MSSELYKYLANNDYLPLLSLILGILHLLKKIIKRKHLLQRSDIYLSENKDDASEPFQGFIVNILIGNQPAWVSQNHISLYGLAVDR